MFWSSNQNTQCHKSHKLQKDGLGYVCHKIDIIKPNVGIIKSTWFASTTTHTVLQIIINVPIFDVNPRNKWNITKRQNEFLKLKF